jgi:uncharacterized integral membrane protein (TIGR00697 family)
MIRKLDLLIALYIFCIVTSELMGAKTFPLWTGGWLNLNTSVSIFTVPIVYSINDIIAEVYGRERIRSIIRAGLVMVVLVMLYSLLCTALPSSTRFAPTESAYQTIFALSARFSFASLLAFAIAEFTDAYVFLKIRKMMGDKALWFRNNVSNFISEFLDTAIFMVIGFYAFNQSFGSNMTFIVGLLIPYWLIKCAMSILETPFVYWGVKWLRTEVSQ